MATDSYFLKIGDIKGESSDAWHKDEIDIESWAWGETNTAAPTTGIATGKVQMRDFLFTMKINKASPLLLKACATGEHFKSAVFTGRKVVGAPQEYLTITLTDVTVVSFQSSDTRTNDAPPTDQFTLNFSKIEYAYRPQKPDGSLEAAITFAWDLKLNKAG